MTKEKLYEIINCDFEKRPVLTWKGFGEVPYDALPKDKDSGYAVLPVRINNPYREDFESAFLNNLNCRLDIIKKIISNSVNFNESVLYI